MIKGKVMGDTGVSGETIKHCLTGAPWHVKGGRRLCNQNNRKVRTVKEKGMQVHFSWDEE